MTESVTAQDYIHDQLELEREARRIMPFEPEECTFTMGEIRQSVFACLTCAKDNQPIGVCYSCSIQCHSTHELVELFSKRNYVCDCGTTKMKHACSLRVRDRTAQPPMLKRRDSIVEYPAEDIPSLSNNYNQNYSGLFCSCKNQYNPLEETGNMIQCYFGAVCGEDWFHEDCILGYTPGLFKKKKEVGSENKLEHLLPPGEDAHTDQVEAVAPTEDVDDDDVVPHFPNLDDFDLFICWKCVDQYKLILLEIENVQEIIFAKLPHFEAVNSAEEWSEKFQALTPDSDEPASKKRKTDIPYSLFLQFNFKDKLKLLSKEKTKLGEFLRNNNYLFDDDPVYEPPEEEDDDSSTTGSLLDLGADALLSLPREQAIEGLHAYDKIKSKLRDFFKPFAEQGTIVTEDKVREFFDKIKEEKE